MHIGPLMEREQMSVGELVVTSPQLHYRSYHIEPQTMNDVFELSESSFWSSTVPGLQVAGGVEIVHPSSQDTDLSIALMCVNCCVAERIFTCNCANALAQE